MKNIVAIGTTLYLFIISCTTNTKESSTDGRSNQVLKRIEIKEYTTKSEFGELVKDALEYHYVETFDEKGYLKESITIFGYDMDLDSTLFIYDTLRYSYKVNKNHVDYYIDDELNEVEVRKGNKIFVYDVEEPKIPMIVREVDSIGNMLMEIATNENELYIREFDITEKDDNGYATKAWSNWSVSEFSPEFDFENLKLDELVKEDSATYLVDFNYIVE